MPAGGAQKVQVVPSGRLPFQGTNPRRR
jgi:hypothetical protein